MTQKEKITEFVNNEMKIPMSFDELKIILCVPQESEKEFFDILNELVEDGVLAATKKKRFAPLSVLNMASGLFCGNERGFGFVEQENDEDIFISPDKLNGAIHGDLVLVKILENAGESKRREGEIIRILKPTEEKIVGRVDVNGNAVFVVPVNRKFSKDIHIDKPFLNGAQNNDMVTVKIIKRAVSKDKPEGKILSVIGNISTPGIDILSVIESRNIPYEFSDEVLSSAEKSSKIPIEDEIKNRLDLREETIITIDGDDAKDLDDAIHVKKLANGNFELGVHIADVGHFVPYKSTVDKEAFARGTSIYLADRVIPMLPEVLSNGVCSLNEGVERLTLSVIMEVDQNGKVCDYNIAESVIRSKRRMTYTNVSDILAGDSEKQERFSDITPMLFEMEKLRNILKKKRTMRGSIDFNFDEARIVLDETGKPVDIVKRERGVSNSIIEEFMLCANETVAEHIFWQGIPFVYRVHEEPDPDSIREFAKFIAPLGYSIKHSHGKVHPRELSDLIKNIAGKPEELVISSVALRSLMKARYSHENLGHFGLASKYYCHFTSPIRRYPDLTIHRIIKDSLNGRLNTEKLSKFVVKSAQQSSDRELGAIEAERQVEDMKKAEFMRERIGDTFEAVITSVTSFGMFASLENTVEGLIRLTDMEGYFVYNDALKTLECEEKGIAYRPGDKVLITVARADALSGKIDFVLYDEDRNIKNFRKKLVREQHKANRTNKNRKIQTARFLKKRRKRR